jgi:predicted nucleic acid-binding protein
VGARRAASTLSFGITFDTGALIALERRRQRIAQVYATAVADGRIVTAPAVAIGEWWRGRTAVRDRILNGLRPEPMDIGLAKLAGKAMARVAGSTLADAVVMASAARRGDVLYTSDVDDMEALRAYFPSVRVLST